MADQFDKGWEELDEPWKRLKWARRRWQLKTGAVNPSAKDAADSLGIKDGTYRAYERPPGTSKHSSFDHQLAIQFSRKFKVSWSWLLTGEGTPFDQLEPMQQRVVRAMAALDESRQEAIAEMVEAMLRTGTRG